jgi:hypothetical protein
MKEHFFMTETTSNKIDKEKPKRFRLSIFGVTLILGVLLVPASIYVACIYTPPLRISEETTRITSPLTADGQIDFFRYIEEKNYPPELATDDNGFRIFVRTFGDVAYSGEFYKEQKYKKLGLDINVAPTMVFPTEPSEILKKYLENNETILELVRKPWTLEELPVLADWVTTSDAPLDAAAEMIRKPVFFVPYLQDEASFRSGKPANLFALILPDIQMFRTFSRQYQVRANYRIAAGNIDGAIDDTITIFQLGRKISQDGQIVQSLVGLAIEGVAMSIPFAENSEHPPTKDKMLQLLDAINHLPPQTTVENTFEWDRCAVLSLLQTFFHGGSFSGAPDLITKSVLLLCNKNIVYRRVNEAYDTITGKRPRAELLSHYIRPARVTANDLKKIFTPGGRGKLLSDLLLLDLFPETDAVEEAFRRTNCTYKMKRLTLALLLYKTEHGEFPKEDWLEKIKPYLGEHFESSLRCPSCSAETEEENVTNYAMILYDQLPAKRDTLLLIELREPVPFKESVVSAADVLKKINRIGSSHSGGWNSAKQSGTVTFFGDTTTLEKRQQLLGIENE